MSTSSFLSPEIVAYLARSNPPEHPELKRCREETAALGGVSMMQISAEQGAFMRIIARLANARNAFEVGVFTGYSALAVALEMQSMHGPAAKLLACDVSEEWTSKGRAYWRAAGVEALIDLQVRPAVETLEARLAAGEAGAYDFGFIDADKTGYDAYYEAGLRLLRPGGVMLFDNMLWNGRVADARETAPDTVALRTLAKKAHDDDRVHTAMLAIGDGVMTCIKK